MTIITGYREVAERTKLQEELNIINKKVEDLVKENQRQAEYIEILEREHLYYEKA